MSLFSQYKWLLVEEEKSFFSFESKWHSCLRDFSNYFHRAATNHISPWENNCKMQWRKSVHSFIHSQSQYEFWVERTKKTVRIEQHWLHILFWSEFFLHLCSDWEWIVFVRWFEMSTTCYSLPIPEIVVCIILFSFSFTSKPIHVHTKIVQISF